MLTAYPHEFLGGMPQRIMLASVMLLEPALLVADAPSSETPDVATAIARRVGRRRAEIWGTATLVGRRRPS